MKHTMNMKAYEMSNHLGNVLVTVSDARIPANGTGGIVGGYAAIVKSATDYSAFGMTMPGRTFVGTDYSFGFNGMLKVDEMKGNGNHYTAPFWEYDPRTGRRWNLDPVFYPWQSRYSAFNNNPIIFVDPLGLFATRKEAREYKKEHNLSGRVKLNQDRTYSIDDRKAHTSIFRDEEFGIQTAALIEAKRTDASTTSPWKLGTEWLSGTGARSREFGAGDVMTELYKKHEHVEQTRQMVMNQLNQSQGQNTAEGSNPYQLSGVEGVGKYIKDYSTLATGGTTGNLAYTYLGSHSLQYTINSVDIEKGTAVVTFLVHNTSTMQSATRPPVIGYQEWYKNSIGKATDKLFQSGPGSETEQWIEWTETIKWK
jgi:RHS repeat-associated protein